MSKLDFSCASFLIPVRLETKERIENLRMIKKFYKKNIEYCEFCFIESDSEPKMKKEGLLSDDDKYMFWKYSGPFCRGQSFNRVYKLSNRDFYICCDTDAIVDPESIDDAFATMRNNENIGIMYPYNGRFMCTTMEYKYFALKDNEITIKKLQSDLLSPSKQVCVHPESLGGCYIIEKNMFKKINGFNPNFVGWGYEDNELAIRTRKLGYEIERIQYAESCLWHLFHDCKKTAPKMEQPKIKENEAIYKEVSDMDIDEIKEYVKTWAI